MSADGLFTAAQTVGSGTLTAQFGGQSAQVPITLIAGPLATITVSPASATLQAGVTQQFTATGYDQYGNVRLTPTWSVEGDIGTIDAAGLFTATTAGNGRVLATVGEVVGAADVQVVPGPLASIAVSPSSVTLTVGGTQQFTATGYDQFGNVRLTPTWSVEGGIGAINAGGLFTAGTVAGAGRVLATVGDVVGAADVTVLPYLPSTLIAFTTDRDGNEEIYMMNSDGTHQTNLTNTNNPAGVAHPSWSPDGRKIAFMSMREGDHEICVMSGSEQTNLTNNPGVDDYPSWSPDGRKIAFSSWRDGLPEVYVMNSDGTNQTRLTNNPEPELQPSWHLMGPRSPLSPAATPTMGFT